MENNKDLIQGIFPIWLWDFWRKEKGLKSFEELREESKQNNEV